MASKRKPRILTIQKNNVVTLIENYFIRFHGCCINVNFQEIDSANWQRIASILNTMGPSKTKEEWKKVIFSIQTTHGHQQEDLRFSVFIS